MNSIFVRRSIREFLDKPVENEKIEQILRAGMQAPSAKNQQAWEFIVVTSQEDKEKVSQMSPFSKLAAKAAVLIVLLGNRDKMTVPDKWQQDMGACTQNMLLQIVKEGLGGVWLGVHPAQERIDSLKDIFAFYRRHDGNMSGRFDIMHKGRLDIIFLFKSKYNIVEPLANIYLVTANDYLIYDKRKSFKYFILATKSYYKLFYKINFNLKLLKFLFKFMVS